MDNIDFIITCKDLIVEYYNNQVDVTDEYTITDKDVYCVWLCSTLGNNKALLSTNVPDGMYYEITYDNNKKKFYFDAYKKWFNQEYEL